MGGNAHEVEDVKTPAAPETNQKDWVTLLVCKCESCTTWEIGYRGDKKHHLFLLCKTCGLEVPLKAFEVDDHHMLHWAQHER